MMRRIASISVSLMLSVAIIALGAGIAFVRCCHTPTMELAPLADLEHHETGSDGDCCGHHNDSHGDGPQICMPDCMEAVVVKLAPTVRAGMPCVSLDTVYFPLSTFSDMMRTALRPVLVTSRARPAACAPHSPPRDYLRLIRILLI